MDHLPTPQPPKYGPPQIRIYIRDDFVCSNDPLFEEYPVTKGWSLEKFEKGDFLQSKTVDESQSFLQEWLYFRLMAAVFNPVGVNIDVDDFVVRRQADLLLDSKALIRYIGKFEIQLRSMTLDNQVQAMIEIQEALKLAQRLVSRQCSMVSDWRLRSESWPYDDETSLSFMVLGATLTYGVRNIVKVLPRQHPDENKAGIIAKQFLIHYEGWGVSKFLHDRMSRDNWCPHRMARLVSGDSSVMGVYYASLMDMPVDRHSHADCKSHECRHAQVKDADYEIAHTHELPECPRVYANIPDIHKALDQDTIPLLSIESDDSSSSPDAIKLTSMPYTPGTKFVAISHVWADGLGNTAGNWLPTCQLKRLLQLCLNLYQFSSRTNPALVWIDTICVPRHYAADTKNYRKIAIDLLPLTYRSADKVLVLDKQLCQSSSVGPPEEILMRILSSGWVSRLWTLQEGLLAGKLRFQFRDRVLDPEDLLSDIMPFHHSSVWFEVHEFFTSLRRLENFGLLTKFRHLWNFLQWRSTSHKTDETVCLAILTGLKPSIVAGLSLEDRMKTFLTQFDQFPADIVFMPGPRLPGEGWGWAPTSFMARYQWSAYGLFDESLIHGAMRHTLQNPSYKSIRTDRGLVLRHNGIKLTHVPPDLDMSFWIKESHRSGQLFWFFAVFIQDKDCPSWTDIDLEAKKELYLMVERFPDRQTSAMALLVDAWPDKRKPVGYPSAFAVRFLGRMLISFSDQPPKQDWIAPRLEAVRGSNVSTLCDGELLEPQLWCVG